MNYYDFIYIWLEEEELNKYSQTWLTFIQVYMYSLNEHKCKTPGRRGAAVTSLLNMGWESVFLDSFKMHACQLELFNSGICSKK